MLAVQSLGGNKRERRRFSAHSANRSSAFAPKCWCASCTVSPTALRAACWGWWRSTSSASRVIEGVLTPGDYGVLFYYYAWLSGALTAIPYVWIRIQQDVPGIRRVFFLMDLPSEAARVGYALPPVRHSIEFAGVGFTYPDGRQALRNVDLTMRAGEITALVGPTGAGKTSLAYLVPGFHDPPRVLYGWTAWICATFPWPACANRSPLYSKSRNCSRIRSWTTSVTATAMRITPASSASPGWLAHTIS